MIAGRADKDGRSTDSTVPTTRMVEAEKILAETANAVPFPGEEDDRVLAATPGRDKQLLAAGRRLATQVIAPDRGRRRAGRIGDNKKLAGRALSAETI